MRNRQNRPLRHEKDSFAIVVEGETEKWYFNMLKRVEHDQLRINLAPKLPVKNTLAEQFNEVKKQAETNTITFWIIDLDVVLDETKQAKKGSKTRLDELKGYMSTLAGKAYKGKVKVIINCPCLEYWFLLHFEPDAKGFTTCADAEKKLKKHMPDYEKTQRFFTREGKDIYTKLKPLLPQAISNAQKIGIFDPEEAAKNISEMNKFFNEPEILALLQQ